MGCGCHDVTLSTSTQGPTGPTGANGSDGTTVLYSLNTAVYTTAGAPTQPILTYNLPPNTLSDNGDGLSISIMGELDAPLSNTDTYKLTLKINGTTITDIIYSYGGNAGYYSNLKAELYKNSTNTMKLVAEKTGIIGTWSPVGVTEIPGLDFTNPIPITIVADSTTNFVGTDLGIVSMKINKTLI